MPPIALAVKHGEFRNYLGAPAISFLSSPHGQPSSVRDGSSNGVNSNSARRVSLVWVSLIVASANAYELDDGFGRAPSAVSRYVGVPEVRDSMVWLSSRLGLPLVGVGTPAPRSALATLTLEYLSTQGVPASHSQSGGLQPLVTQASCLTRTGVLTSCASARTARALTRTNNAHFGTSTTQELGLSPNSWLSLLYDILSQRKGA